MVQNARRICRTKIDLVVVKQRLRSPHWVVLLGGGQHRRGEVVQARNPARNVVEVSRIDVCEVGTAELDVPVAERYDEALEGEKEKKREKEKK